MQLFLLSALNLQPLLNKVCVFDKKEGMYIYTFIHYFNTTDGKMSIELKVVFLFYFKANFKYSLFF